MTTSLASANLASGLSNVSLGRACGPDLYDFLVEAELEHYCGQLKNDLKVSTVAHLKYVEDDDLSNLGMSKPEMRRLKKFYHKYYPQNYLLRIKKKLISKGDHGGVRTTTSHPVEPFASPVSSSSTTNSVSDKQSRVPSKHIISADSITINKELGVGEFGVVQQGVWTNEEGHRIQVAIKMLSKERLQNNSMDFLKEASIMHSIYSEHIVRLYGVVLETSTLMLVTELAPLRSLLECLKEPALRPSFPVMTLCEFAIQICDGMQYLENKRLIHRDLAARNILVFSKNKVKISDFGLSRALGVGKDYYQTNFNVNLKLPIAWCAPECINYLRFTSASDVWAFGVTLWELFSYGFQPWAALTGQQILEAIDEPQFQRLEQPECCPREYYSLMVRCWQPLPERRPKFSDIWTLLPECKPEQVQAVKDSEESAISVNTGAANIVAKTKKEMLIFRTGEVITVLDQKPQPDNTSVWKGVLVNGKTGLFYPANTVAYLGTEMPSVKPNFIRPDGKSGGVYSSRRRLRPEMISGPQEDLKHISHVGLDGAFFGDITFLGDKYGQLPKQIVAPYKPQDDRSLMRAQPDVSDRAPLIGTESRNGSTSDSNWVPENESKSSSSDTMIVNKIDSGVSSSSIRPSGYATNDKRHPSESPLTEHEYHEISDDDEEFGLDGAGCKIDENYFQNKLDFGPSLMDEVFTALNCRPDGSDPNVDQQDSASSSLNAAIDRDNNARNEIRELVARVTSSTSGVETGSGSSGGVFSSLKRATKKHNQTVKPISTADAKTIDSAIAIANELANRNMLDMDGGMNGGFNGGGGGSRSESDSPRTPSSPNKRKFSFKFGSGSKDSKSNNNSVSPRSEKRNFSREAASIPDIQASLTEEAKDAYNSLVEKRNFESTTNLVAEAEENDGDKDEVIVTASNTTSDVQSQQKEVETNPLRMLRSGVPVRPKIRGNKHSFGAGSSRSNSAHQQPQSTQIETLNRVDKNIVVGSIINGGLGMENGTVSTDHVSNNLLPLPPRDRSKPMPTHKPRQRKHPLIIPTTGGSRTLVKPSLCSSIPDPNPTSPSNSSCTSSDFQSPISPLEIQFPAKFQSDDQQMNSPVENMNAIGLPDVNTFAPAKPPRLQHNLDDSFECQIQADMDSLDDIPEEEAPVPPMYRNSDHVSCEDLMDFALDLPNAKRTQGRARGIDSDEVRIMQKVLANEVGSKECVEALNETDWDVHKAIKYLKLRLLLLTNRLVGNASVNNSCKQTLMSCGWDVQKAYAYLTATYGVTEDSTEV